MRLPVCAAIVALLVGLVAPSDAAAAAIGVNGSQITVTVTGDPAVNGLHGWDFWSSVNTSFGSDTTCGPDEDAGRCAQILAALPSFSDPFNLTFTFDTSVTGLSAEAAGGTVFASSTWTTPFTSPSQALFSAGPWQPVPFWGVSDPPDPAIDTPGSYVQFDFQGSDALLEAVSASAVYSCDPSDPLCTFDFISIRRIFGGATRLDPWSGDPLEFLTYMLASGGEFDVREELFSGSDFLGLYGTGVLSPASTPPVPEPASLLLIGTGLALAARRRRRTM